MVVVCHPCISKYFPIIKRLTMNNFKEEAEKQYPGTGSHDVFITTDGNIRDRDIENFISGADFGYKQGIEEGMRFAEWTRHQLTYYYNLDERLWRFRLHHDKRFTTAELFEIFKPERNDSK